MLPNLFFAHFSFLLAESSLKCLGLSVVVCVVFSSDQGWQARPAPGSPACGGGEEILMCWEIRLIYQLQLHFLLRQESLTHKVEEGTILLGLLADCIEVFYGVLWLYYKFWWLQFL